ncbi:MAG: hypothetical protein GWN16_01965 [Calditrichae bacterium]|nr:hypothetical protein [Calditrichia bacterium]
MLNEDAVSRWSLWTGIGISFLNTIIGFAILSWGINRSNKSFLISVYGGMIFRFLLIFALLFILIGALQAEMITLISSFMITYFLFLGLEVLQIHKYAEMQKD